MTNRVHAPRREAGGPLFMPVDRAFSIRGFGTVATGTIHSGSIRLDDEVELVPGGPDAIRVRGLQTHGKEQEVIPAGMRAAVNLAGVAAESVERGMVISHSGLVPPSRMLDVELTLLEAAPHPIRHRSKLLLHLGTSRALASVVLTDRKELLPGDTTFAQLRLGEDVAALPSQRFLLRGSSTLQGRGRTIAGGRVLAVSPRKLRPGTVSKRRFEILRSGTADEKAAQLLLEAGTKGLSRAGLSVRSGIADMEMNRLLQRLGAKGEAICFDREGGRWISGALFRRLVEKSGEAVRAHHQRHPLAPGLPKEELRHRLGVEVKLFARLLPQLETSGLVTIGEVIREEGHRPGSEDPDVALESKLHGWIVEGKRSPPSVGELSKRADEKVERILAVLRLLEGKKRVVRVAKHLYYDAEVLGALQRELVGYLLDEGSITTQDFKELAGTSRKWLIPLSEYFDGQRVTVRVDDAARVLWGETDTWKAWMSRSS